MWARHPKIAAKWTKKYGSAIDQPKKVGAKRKVKDLKSYVKHKLLRKVRYARKGR